MTQNHSDKPVFLDDYLERYQKMLLEEDNSLSPRYRSILIDTCALVENCFPHIAIQDITPDMIAEQMDHLIRIGKAKASTSSTILRWCFQNAFEEGVIDLNPMVHIHLKESRCRSSSILTSEQYEKIKDAFYSVPGGKVIGLLAFMNLPLNAINCIIYDNCDLELNTIRYPYLKKMRMKVLVDPDAIQLFHVNMNDYLTRMANPEICERNKEHYLLSNRFGLPYTIHQLWYLVQLLFDEADEPEMNYTKLRQALRLRAL